MRFPAINRAPLGSREERARRFFTGLGYHPPGPPCGHGGSEVMGSQNGTAVSFIGQGDRQQIGSSRSSRLDRHARGRGARQ